MELYQIAVPSGFVTKPFPVKVNGKFIKVESVPSGNTLYIKTSEGETFLGKERYSIEFEKEFEWIQIQGADEETIQLQIGLGWILQDAPEDVNVLTLPNVYLQYQVGTPATINPAATADVSFPPLYPGGTIYVVDPSAAIDLQITDIYEGNILRDAPDGILFDSNHNPVPLNQITAPGLYYVFTYGTSGFRLTNNAAVAVQYSYNLLQQPMIFPG